MVIKTLIKSIKNYKKETIITPIFVAMEVVMECIIPFIMALLIDNMKANTITPIIKYSVILVVLAIFSLFFGFMSGKTSATASCGYAKNLREDLFFKVQNFSFQDIDKFSTASLVTRLTTDVTNVQNAFQMVIRLAVRVPLMLVFSMVMSFAISWKISLVFLAILPFLFLGVAIILKIVMPLFKRVFKKYDALNNSVQENINGIRVVKTYVREDYEKDKFNKGATELKNDFTKIEKIIAFSSPAFLFFMYLAIVIVSFWGANLIINSKGIEMTTGQLSSLINYGIQILISIIMFTMVFVMISISTESAKRITEVLEQNPTLISKENAETYVANGDIVFKDVFFKYSKEAENYALKDINLSIKSGQTIGILGSTGSAKSSLIQLIPRLYDTTEGEVLVGDKNVKEYEIDALRNEVAVVLQKNTLFSGTIKDNLRWGNKEASDEEIIRVCKLAKADEFIEKMPDKYDSVVEQGGTNFSGGQKQRLCIARALLKKPKIIIFDDSTSAVDTKTDALIRKALNEEIPQTTKIIIAQRVASVENADKILIMEGGQIIESGTNKELLDKKGIYYDIYLSQIKGKETNNAK